MSFDPNTLASQPATEDMKRDYIDQSTADFVEMCKRDKENGQLQMCLSGAVTLAVSFHNQLSRMIGHKDAAQFQMIWKAMDARSKRACVFMAPIAYGMALQRLEVEGACDEHKNDKVLLAAIAADILQAATICAESAAKIEKDVANAIRLVKAHEDADGSMSQPVKSAIGQATIHIKNMDQPPQT